jgi:molybdopterin synthase catalytic subunit
MVLITSNPIDPRGSYDLISRNAAGSVIFHYAVVKGQEGAGGETCHIVYGVAGDAEDELRRIAGDMAAAWNIEDLLLIRRIGRLGIGEIISLVAVSSPASEDAFAACKFGIGRLKKMQNIIKNEVFG